ncbi:hypothetical protein FACS189492_0830 [Clostridia bacterium]|nr:hypothetical protein FACS189492_0830 [Clostridia bacterium]
MAVHLNQYKQDVWEQHIRRLLYGYSIEPLPDGFGFSQWLLELSDAWKTIILVSNDDTENETIFLQELAAFLEQYKTFRISLDDCSCFVLLTDKNVEATKINDIIQEIDSLAQNRVMMGYGMSFRQMDMMPVAFEQARQILMYNQLVGVNSSESADVSGRTSDDVNVTLPELMKLHNSIKTSNYVEAEKVFDDITLRCLFDVGISAQLIKCNMLAIMNILMTSFDESLNDDFRDKQGGIKERLLGCASVNEFVQKTKDVFRILYERSIVNKKESTNRQQEKMEQILREHYRDPDFSVSIMAEQLHIDPSHLSRKYKQMNQINLLDKIHQLRIEEAKKLLVQGKYTIHEIGALVGYGSELTFLRAFKRIEGIPPSQYREMYTKKS